jgi:hypothetical protein
MATGPSRRPGPAGHGALPGQVDVVDRQAEMHVSRIWGRLRIGLPVRRFVIEQFEHDAAGKVDEGRTDRDAGDANVFAKVGPVENRAPARLDPEEVLPKRQRLVEIGDAHADVMHRRGRRDRPRSDYWLIQTRPPHCRG